MVVFFEKYESQLVKSNPAKNITKLNHAKT